MGSRNQVKGWGGIALTGGRWRGQRRAGKQVWPSPHHPADGEGAVAGQIFGVSIFALFSSKHDHFELKPVGSFFLSERLKRLQKQDVFGHFLGGLGQGGGGEPNF